MANFLQLHFLTAYAPSNLNRDDTGRPKSAIFGGVNRLRVSSQSLKRAWRSSSVFSSRLGELRAFRTKKAGELVYETLLAGGIESESASAIARTVAAIAGKPEKPDKNPLHIAQLAFLSPAEIEKFKDLARWIVEEKKLQDELASYGGSIEEDDAETDEDKPEKKSKKKGGLSKKRLSELRSEVLIKSDTAADIAMFGRMMADSAQYNIEAAVQVAHALTTHKAVAEDDYYTAVDDLAKAEESGAGFVGVQEFGAGVFYIYICVDRDLLLKNLGGDHAVRDAALAALVEAAATVGPNGKQNSFASRAYASYALGEKGPQQPRSLAAAFLNPVSKGDQCKESISELDKFRERLDAAYGACADSRYAMNLVSGEGTLTGLIGFAIA